MYLHTILPEGLLAAGLRAEMGLSAEDRLMIQDLVHRFAMSVDARDYEAIRGIVTDDFLSDHPVERTQGAEAFVDFVRSHLWIFDGVRHQHLNVVAQGDGQGGALAISYALVMKTFRTGMPPNDDLPSVVGHGLITDRFRREGEVWRLARRSYEQVSVSAVMVPEGEQRRRFSITAKERHAHDTRH